MVQELMSKARTKTGLRVRVRIVQHLSQRGGKVAANFKERMRVLFDEELRQWNYRILPGEIPCGQLV